MTLTTQGKERGETTAPHKRHFTAPEQNFSTEMFSWILTELTSSRDERLGLGLAVCLMGTIYYDKMPEFHALTQGSSNENRSPAGWRL